MDLATVYRRARRGVREEFRLHAIAVASLGVAFLCLGISLLALQNIRVVGNVLGHSHRLSIYLEQEASESVVNKLGDRLRAMHGVESVDHVSALEARTQFIDESSLGKGLEALPEEVFRPSFEVSLDLNVSKDRSAQLQAQIEQTPMVTEVDNYAHWFTQLGKLLDGARIAALVVSLLVLVCVLTVVGNTVRLAVENRRNEIEMMKLCGATDGFVRAPLVMEGVMQGLVAALGSQLVLLSLYLLLREELNAVLGPLTGLVTVFLPGWMMATITMVGGALGAAGSAWSIRQHLEV